MAKITIIYSLLSHSGSVTQGNTIEEANALNQRAQVIPGRFADGRRIVTVDSPAVQIDAVKKAEDDGAIVVCIHEYRGSQTKFTLPCAPNTRWGDYTLQSAGACNERGNHRIRSFQCT